MKSRRLLVLGAAAMAVAGLAGSAQATLFSFASDMNSNAYTFGGTAGSGPAGAFSITDFSRPNTFALHIDDNNGPLATLMIPVEFRANITAQTLSSTNLVGSLWQHSYKVSGSFGFYNAAGTALLTVAIGSTNPGVLTVPGTATAWSSTGAVLGANSFSDITYTVSSAFIAAMGGASNAALYGITLGNLGSPADFAFDLSALNGSATSMAVGIDPVTKAPTGAWRSESSYSGRAGGLVPSPGAAALLGAGGLLVGVRRRRN